MRRQNGDGDVGDRGIRSEHKRPTNQRESENMYQSGKRTIPFDDQKEFCYQVKEKNLVFPVSKSKWNMTRKYGGGGDGNEGNREEEEGHWKDFLEKKKIR